MSALHNETNQAHETKSRFETANNIRWEFFSYTFFRKILIFISSNNFFFFESGIFGGLYLIISVTILIASDVLYLFSDSE